MTRATVRIGHDRLYLRLDGHAERADCCAAVSMLAYGLAGMMNCFPDRIRHREAVSLKEGDVVIDCVGDTHAAEWFQFVAVGLMTLEGTYPECVKADVRAYGETI
jgi:uncharacterized protein YsxB (DUF464 family)